MPYKDSINITYEYLNMLKVSKIRHSNILFKLKAKFLCNLSMILQVSKQELL